MFKKLLFVGFFYFLIILSGYSYVSAGRLMYVSDTISTSWPGASSSHTLIFSTSNQVPASGKIEIMLESGAFTIPDGFGYEDVDLATSTSVWGPFYDRTVASSPSASADGITVATGTAGSVTITLNSTAGIAAGEYVQVELGTIADFGISGDSRILNPVDKKGYQIYVTTYNSADTLIDSALTYMAVVDPVTMSVLPPKRREDGSPSGVLDYGTTQVYMSLSTNYLANCRYSTASGTPYDSMTDTFTYTDDLFHQVLLTGLVEHVDYIYYIRCRDNDGEDDTTDFIISFVIGEGDYPDEDEDGDGAGYRPGGGGTGGGSGGGTGQTTGPGAGDFLPFPPPPSSPSAILRGWAYSGSEVFILKDGQEETGAQADTKAAFEAAISDLTEGVYTFGLWSRDSAGRKSITYTTTFWVHDGTKTVVSDIILPPTIALSDNSIALGETFSVFGETVPLRTVEVWFYPDKSYVREDEYIKTTTVSDEAGRWNTGFDTAGLGSGVYLVKARVSMGTAGTSGFSEILKLGVGVELAEEVCSGADLNGDGRVNITDFSILLYWWGTDNECADQNKDGTVDLIDFSIMMYYWTG